MPTSYFQNTPKYIEAKLQGEYQNNHKLYPQLQNYTCKVEKKFKIPWPSARKEAIMYEKLLSSLSSLLKPNEGIKPVTFCVSMLLFWY